MKMRHGPINIRFVTMLRASLEVFTNLISKENDRARAVEMLCSDCLLRFHT